MKKIRLVFEAEVDQSKEITLDIMRRAWGTFSVPDMERSQDWQEQIQDEKALLSALLANPAVYKEFLLNTLITAVESMSMDKYTQILGFNRGNYYELEKLLPSLPADSTERLQQAIDNGAFSECSSLVNSSIEATITNIHIEEAK